MTITKVGETDAVILAGGSGTRLRPVISEIPKSLAPIRGRPFLDLLIEFLAGQGISRIVFCVGHLGGMIISRYRDWPGITSVFSKEVEPLGTGGAVHQALGVVRTDPFLLLNGDSICRVALMPLVRLHRERSALATLTLSDATGRSDVGSVLLDEGDRVHAFAEKAVPEEVARRRFANAGVYVLQKEVFASHRRGCYSLEHDLLPPLARTGRCHGFVTGAPIIDIGTPERYSRAQTDL